MKPLFVAGSPRSGTTGLIDYLNQHPEILVCRERYKFVPLRVDPSLLTFERILDYGEKETNISREFHMKLLAKKDPVRLKWIGDKYPHYVKYFKTLAKNNPGARFLVLYRPIEEVAESFEARSRNPDDRWPEENGFEAGVRIWNSALEYTREFIESRPNHNVLIVSYHDFFYRNEACIPLISRFLGVEFGESVREAWRTLSSQFEERRRSKEPLSEEQQAYIKANNDHAVEEWILVRMDEQWRELG